MFSLLVEYGTFLFGYASFLLVICMHISVYYLIYRCFRLLSWDEIVCGRIRKMLVWLQSNEESLREEMRRVNEQLDYEEELMEEEEDEEEWDAQDLDEDFDILQEPNEDTEAAMGGCCQGNQEQHLEKVGRTREITVW